MQSCGGLDGQALTAAIAAAKAGVAKPSLIAIRNRHRPTLMALWPQDVPQLWVDAAGQNLTARGAYVIRQFKPQRDVTLIATGTEVALAIQAAEVLDAKGCGVAVVSRPASDLFDGQPEAYRAGVLGSAPRIAIEAAGKFGGTRYVASEDDVIGMLGFGTSAPAKRLYQEFGTTMEAIVAQVRVQTLLR